MARFLVTECFNNVNIVRLAGLVKTTENCDVTMVDDGRQVFLLENFLDSVISNWITVSVRTISVEQFISVSPPALLCLAEILLGLFITRLLDILDKSLHGLYFSFTLLVVLPDRVSGQTLNQILCQALSDFTGTLMVTGGCEQFIADTSYSRVLNLTLG